MRPSFRGFFRVGHHVAASRGGGIGAALLAATLEALPPPPLHAALVAAILDETPATAIHLLEKDAAVEPVPFAVPAGNGAALPDAAAILVECYDRALLHAIGQALDAALGASGTAPPTGWTEYDLAFMLDADERGDVAPARRPRSP
jgi:hypothetical protein